MRACNNLPQPNPYILVFGGCGRLLYALTPPRSAFLYLQFLAQCHPYILLHFLYLCTIVCGYFSTCILWHNNVHCVCVCVCVFRFMARKLYTFASGQCMAESSDSPMNQEILLGGHFYLMVLKVNLKMIFCEPHMWTCTYIHTYTCIIC